MPFGVLTRDEWVERTTRLICIYDPLVRRSEAESLALALWDRPLIDESAATSTAVHMLEQLRHDHEDRRVVFRKAA